MWLRCTTDESPVIINAERIVKIVEKPKEKGGAFDQTLAEIMEHLGFEDRSSGGWSA
jgi:hypothetical protein